jgi:metal-responsive CopG/Arc/MetJ family transcriptional regulator
MVKVTFTLDERTVEHLNETARRLSKPKSEIVREAIEDAYAKSDKLTPEKQQRMLGILREYAKIPKVGTSAEADREIQEIRESRRSGWRPGAR